MARKTLHGQSGWTLEGTGALIENLANRASPEKRREALEAAAQVVEREAVKLAPRDTGLLEFEIEVRWLAEGKVIGVGVPLTSPAYTRAWVTEYGSVLAEPPVMVGSVASPRTSWPSQSKGGSTMPWLRPAVLRSRARAYAAMRRVLLGK